MFVCRECRSEIYTGSLFCPECGVTTLGDEVLATSDLSLAGYRSVQTKPLEPIENGVIEAERIVFTIPKSGWTRTMAVKSEIRIGRADPSHAFYPELDLTEQSGTEFGVSRLHATIETLDRGIMIIDRGSTNGTLLNKRRLRPDTPYPLREGDEIRFGNLMVKIRFES